MILEDSPIIIEYSSLWARHDVEVVGGAGVFIVMDQRCHQCCQDLNVIQPILLDYDISVNFASMEMYCVECHCEGEAMHFKGVYTRLY